jgi:hypothetical protein
MRLPLALILSWREVGFAVYQGTALAVPQGGAVKTGFSRRGCLAGAKALVTRGVSIGTAEAMP